MALQKTFTSPSGADGNYWSIRSAHLDKGDVEAMNMVLALYKDSTAYGAGSQPLHREEYSFNTESPDEFTGSFDAATLDTLNYNLKERAYEKLKTLTTPVDFTTGTTDV